MVPCLLLVAEMWFSNYITIQKPHPLFGSRQIQQVVCNLSFGSRQVEQFMCDRPVTADIIKCDPTLRLLLIYYFAGELNGVRVYWDSREPRTGQPAEHVAALSEYPAMIRVSSQHAASGVDKCMMLVFELHNQQLDDKFNLLCIAVVQKSIDRDVFARSCVRLEFVARKKTQSFFREHPLGKIDFKESPAYSNLIQESMEFSDYLGWLERLDSKAYNPLNYFRQHYDDLSSSARQGAVMPRVDAR